MEQQKLATFAVQCAQQALRLLVDPEARVRIAVGDCLGTAASNAGTDVWDLAAKPVMQVIDYCWVTSFPGAANSKADMPCKEMETRLKPAKG